MYSWQDFTPDSALSQSLLPLVVKERKQQTSLAVPWGKETGAHYLVNYTTKLNKNMTIRH